MIFGRNAKDVECVLFPNFVKPAVWTIPLTPVWSTASLSWSTRTAPEQLNGLGKASMRLGIYPNTSKKDGCYCNWFYTYTPRKKMRMICLCMLFCVQNTGKKNENCIQIWKHPLKSVINCWILFFPIIASWRWPNSATSPSRWSSWEKARACFCVLWRRSWKLSWQKHPAACRHQDNPLESASRYPWSLILSWVKSILSSKETKTLKTETRICTIVLNAYEDKDPIMVASSVKKWLFSSSPMFFSSNHPFVSIVPALF